MKSAAIGCLAGAGICALLGAASWVQWVRLDRVVEVIEAEAAPLERGKVVEAIALLLPDNDKKEPALRLIRTGHEETKTYHAAWLNTARALQRSAETKGIISLGIMMMFIGVLALMRRDEQKAP